MFTATGVYLHIIIVYECRHVHSHSYVGVLFLYLNYLLFPDNQHGLSEFHSVECHSIAKYTAGVVTGMSQSVCLC